MLENTLLEDDFDGAIDDDDSSFIFGTALFHLLDVNEGIVVEYNEEKVIVHKSTGDDGVSRMNIDYFEDAVNLIEGQLVILKYDNEEQFEYEDSVVTIIPIDMDTPSVVH